MIAPGRLLIRTAEPVASAEENAPVMEAFRAFLADQMQKHPARMEPFSGADVEGLDELLAGVEYDPVERLDDAVELP